VRGEIASYVLRIKSVRAFTGAVTFGVERLPDGIDTTFDPPFISPPADGFAYATLRVRPDVPFISLPAGPPVNASTGFFNFIIFATQTRFISAGENLTQAKRFSVSMRIIEPGTPDFLVGIFPDQQFTNFQQFTPTIVSTGVFVEPRNGFSGRLIFDLSNPPPGLSFTFEPLFLTFAAGEGKKVSFLKLTLFEGFATVTTNYLFAVSVTLTNTTGIPASGMQITKSGVFKLTVAAIPDFSVIATPAVKSVTPGGTASYTLVLRSAPTVGLGYSGPVLLDLRGTPRLPFDVTFRYEPQPVNLTPGLDQQATLTVFTTPRTQADRYNLTVTATGGGTTKRQTVTLAVTPIGDFNVTLDPSSLAIGLGVSRVVNVRVQSLSGFQSLVNLTIAGAPTPDTGVSVTIAPDNIQPNPGNTLTAAMTVSTTKGAFQRTYVMSVIGRSGILTHEAKFILSVRTTQSCVIATSAFGSEMSPEVMFLRDFRDTRILATSTGTSFMQSFNSWYYSFSPALAYGISKDPALQEAARGMLYPLVESLRVSDSVFRSSPNQPEFAVIASGLVGGLLIGLFYLAPVVAAVTLLTRRVACARSPMLFLIGSVTITVLGYQERLSEVLAVGSASLALAAVIVGGVLPACIIRLRLRKHLGSLKRFNQP